MHRTITSDDVENYASHIPADEVKLNKEEDIMYQNGVLKYASGVTSCKLMPKVRLAHALALLHYKPLSFIIIANHSLRLVKK